jgi:hypothetical protein
MSSTAETILEQLGGHRFVVMTGARHLIADGPSLVFQIPRRMAKDGINVVKITLDGTDTYTMVFSKQADSRGGYKMTTVHEVSGVYDAQLREIFERTTGLATSLGTMGRSGDRRSSRKSRGHGDKNRDWWWWAVARPHDRRRKRSSRGTGRRSRRGR